MYELLEYVTETGSRPFREWLDGLRDRQAKRRLLARLTKVELGNLGDWKAIDGTPGLFELREHFGPGYRIYYAVIGQQILLLLAGSDKSDQSRVILRAKAYLDDYERRTP